MTNVRPQALLALLLSLAACAAAAQAEAPRAATVVESGPGWGIATTTTTASARVIAVDVAARRIDLMTPDGSVVSVAAGPEVRRIGDIHAGDTVNASWVDTLSLVLVPKGSAIVSRSQEGDVRRAPSGSAPAGVRENRTTVLADVIAVDHANGLLTLRGPKESLTLQLKDPRQLALVRPGDQVQATYTEAVAVSVEPVR